MKTEENVLDSIICRGMNSWEIDNKKPRFLKYDNSYILYENKVDFKNIKKEGAELSNSDETSASKVSEEENSSKQLTSVINPDDMQLEIIKFTKLHNELNDRLEKQKLGFRSSSTGFVNSALQKFRK